MIAHKGLQFHTLNFEEQIWTKKIGSGCFCNITVSTFAITVCYMLPILLKLLYFQELCERVRLRQDNKGWNF